MLATTLGTPTGLNPNNDGLVHVRPPHVALNQHFHLDDARVAYVQCLEDALPKLFWDHNLASPQQTAIMNRELMLPEDEGLEPQIHRSIQPPPPQPVENTGNDVVLGREGGGGDWSSWQVLN